MDKELQKKFDILKNVSLSTDEKKKTRDELVSFVRVHPVRNVDVGRHIQKEGSIINLFINQLTSMPIIIGLILAISGGTAFAAESSLPGDLLYPIKVSVNEEIRATVTISDEAKARWDARRAERRLEEMETLAAEGRLDAEVRANVEARFERHAERFEERALRIGARAETQAAFEAHSNFEASLAAHEQILTRLAAHEDVDAEELGHVLFTVRARLLHTAEARGAVEADVRARVNGDFKVAADGKLSAAEKHVNGVRVFIEARKAEVSAEAYAEAEAQVAKADEAIANGKTHMEAGAYGEAFASFQQAMRLAQEAKVLVATEGHFELTLPIRGMVDVESRMKGDFSRGMMMDKKDEEEAQSDSQTMEQKTNREKAVVDVELDADANVDDVVDAEADGSVRIDVELQ